MDRSRRLARSTALLAALAATAILLATPRAGAEDVFRFDNETGEGFTTAGRDFVPECWFGASGALAGGNEPKVSGQIRADVGPFEDCGEFWGTELAYGQTFLESYQASNGENVAFWEGGTGSFEFSAEDPAVGPATLTCRAAGVEYAEDGGQTPIERTMSAQVEGTTCVVEWLPGAGPGRLARAAALAPAKARYSRLVSSLATVRSGVAGVMVQTFSPRRLAVDDEVVLRTRGGRLVGRGRTQLRVGDRAKLVSVPLSTAARAALAEKGYLVVKANLRHVDGSPGSGDTTSRLVLRHHSARQ